MPKVCIVPVVDGIGGGASFRNKFEAGLAARSVQVTHDPDDAPDAVLVLGGTKNIAPLLRARKRGVRIVQRLDGINWIHRKRNTGIRHFVRAEYGNFVLSFIRARVATHILYQSEFSHHWWEDWYGRSQAPFTVIHNGVDLNIYSPDGIGGPPAEHCRLLIVEGSLGGGYDMGLDHAIALAETLAEKYSLPMELMVVGKVSGEHSARVQAHARIPIIWKGAVARAQIPEIDRSAHLLFSADLNAACPNSVIEALACGLPVAAFDTGALNELVVGDAGRLAPYGGDTWKLDKPDISGLAQAAVEVLHDLPRFRAGARARAESSLGLDLMVDRYLKFLLED